MQDAQPVLKYPGSKWRRASWIISHFSAFRTYVEPFFGSGAVYFSLDSLPEYAILNDKCGSVVNLFRIIRERGEELAAAVEMTPWSRQEYEESYVLTGEPFEDARRFLVRCWMAHGTQTSMRTGWRNRGSADGGFTTKLWNYLPDRLLAIVERLKCAEIENRPALEVIERYRDQPDCLIYADPPYVLKTRRNRKLYEEEMTDQEHVALLEALERHSGPVVLSGYASALYDQRLAHWQRLSKVTQTEKGQTRTEVLWLNPQVMRQPGLFDETSW